MKLYKNPVLVSSILAFSISLVTTMGQGGDATTGNSVDAKGPVDVRGDGGVEAVQNAQVDLGGEHYKAGISAQQLISTWLRKDQYREGWDEGKKRFITIGVGEFNSEDPTIDPNKFAINREVALQRALLDARASIVEFANSKLDIYLQAETPGTDLHAEFGEKKEIALRRLLAQQNVVAKLLEDVDKSEANALSGVTGQDRINALMDAAIKRLDTNYSKNNIEDEKRNKLAVAKQRFQEATNELSKIEAEIKKTVGNVTRSFSSKINKLAKMPLFGSTCIYQTESWNSKDEKYTVAVALVWSVGLEKSTRAIIQGQEIIMDNPKKGTTLEEWLEGQDLGSIIGPRTFMDEKGQRYFIGVAARPVVPQASRMEKNRDIARLQADAITVLSLRVDVEVVKTAQQMAQTTNTSDDKEEEKAMDSLTKKIQAKIEGQNINGLGRILEKEVNHALTGIKLLVTISGINPDAVKAARTLEEINYAAAIVANKENARLQGRKDQLEASKDASKNDRGSYEKGRQDANSALQNQEAERKAQALKKEDQAKQADALKRQGKSQNKTLDGSTGSRPAKKDDQF